MPDYCRCRDAADAAYVFAYFRDVAIAIVYRLRRLPAAYALFAHAAAQFFADICPAFDSDA